MSRPMPESEFGPDIQWREFSFLENPRAAELNKSVLTLQVCQVGAGGVLGAAGCWGQLGAMLPSLPSPPSPGLASFGLTYRHHS